MGAHGTVANRSARADCQDAARDDSAKCARLPYQRDGTGALGLVREACLHAPDVCLGPLPAGRRARARIVHPPAVPSSSSGARSASDTVPFGRCTVTVPLTTPGSERGARPLVWSQPCGPPTCGPPPDGRTTNCADDTSHAARSTRCLRRGRGAPAPARGQPCHRAAGSPAPSTAAGTASTQRGSADWRARHAGGASYRLADVQSSDSVTPPVTRTGARLAHWLLGCHAFRRSD